MKYNYCKYFLLVFFIFSVVKASSQIPTGTGKDMKTFTNTLDVVKNVNLDSVPHLIRISKENHIHKLGINNKPCASVADGSRIIFECWDALEGRSKEFFNNNTPYLERLPYANPATGPIFIEGVLPGDVLEVEIHNIKLSRFGFMNLHKNRFINSDAQEVVYIETEVIGDQMLYNGRKMPVQPMVGVIGIAGQEEILTQEVGDNGGNMDTRIIKKGSKVLLPVYTEGALLAIGDVHAAMGDGEVNGMGLEIGAEVEVTVRVRKDLKIQRPIIINNDRVACIASNPDILAAKDQVLQDMGKYLVDECGFSSTDASALLAFYGNLHFCQVVNPQKTVRVEVERQYMDLFGHKALPF